MGLLESAKTFVGIDGSPHEQASGRRRVVAYGSFICFVLLAAALGEEEWVAGNSSYISRWAPPNLAAFNCGDEDVFLPGRRLQYACVGAPLRFARRPIPFSVAPAAAETPPTRSNKPSRLGSRLSP